MHCTDCQRDLAGAAPVYRYRAPSKGGATMIQCADCAAQFAARENRWSGWGWKWRPPAPCEGCGRPVIDRENGGYVQRRHITCGEPACQRAIRAAATRARRRREPRDCTVCGTTFEPARSHALFCSAPCRQRAYRQRLGASRVRA